jgi:hypothetical protein
MLSPRSLRCLFCSRFVLTAAPAQHHQEERQRGNRRNNRIETAARPNDGHAAATVRKLRGGRQPKEGPAEWNGWGGEGVCAAEAGSGD